MAPFSHESAPMAVVDYHRSHGKLRSHIASVFQKESRFYLMPVNPRSTIGNTSTSFMRLGIVLLCAVVILAACGSGSSSDNDEGHQFAGDGKSTAAPTATARTDSRDDVRPTAVPTLEPEELFALRGAPQFLYLSAGDDLQVYDTAARSFTLINVSSDLVILDYTSSPTGDRIGILGLLDQNIVVQFFGADGQELGDPIRLSLAFTPARRYPVASPAATPNATPKATPTYMRDELTLQVTWIPQGNAVVVSGPGVLQRVSMSGTIMPISRTGVTGIVVKGLWSPMDSQIAILTQMMDGHQGVFMLNSGRADANELEMLHLEPHQSLANLQWLPNGLGLVFVAGNNNDGVLMNGQLYVYKFGEPVPTLIATSGQGGPAGTISHAAVSPDGHTVAYAIMVRDQDTWHLHSLWLRPVKGGSSVSVPLKSDAPITGLFWTAEGLVWQQENGSLSVVDGDLIPRTLGDEPVATPVSSPQSTPVVEVTPRG